MKVQVANTYSPLEEVILGGIDLSVGNIVNYNSTIDKILNDTIEDLNTIEKTLTELGVIVHRPSNKINCDKPIHTPQWSEVGSRIPLSPRDIFLVIGDTIVETTPMSRFRYFEHWAYKDIMTDCFKDGANWISMPSPALYEDRDEGEPLLEAASVIQHDDELFVSTTVTANRLGITWLERNFPNHTIHEFGEKFDAHLDAHFNIVRPGLIATHIDRKYFPKYFKDWDFIYLNTDMDRKISKKQEFIHDNIQDDDHENTALTINFLSIDESRMLIYDHHNVSDALLKQLENHNIEPIFVPFRHCHFFNQGLTCITLELRRTLYSSK
jgi:glycine amidinotransferase